MPSCRFISVYLLGLLSLACNSTMATESDATETSDQTTGTGTTELPTTETGDTDTETESDTETDTGTEPVSELVAYESRDVDNWVLHVIEPSGAGDQILEMDTSLGGATWSPDGLWIATPVLDVVSSDIFVFDVEGGTSTQLTDDSAEESRLRWSPAGPEIAYVSTGGPNYFDLFVVDVETTQLRQVSDIPDAESLWFDWAPTGDRLAVAANILDIGPQLFMVSTTGDAIDELTSVGQFDELHGPAWSPSGEWIAFSGRDEFYPVIRLIQPDGSGLMPATDVFGINPSWSPDSASLAFRGDDAGVFRVALMDLGGVPEFVGGTQGLEDCDYPKWSADGTRVVFHCSPLIDESSIYMVVVDGGEISTLVDGGANYAPIWRPNSVP
jgi:Tol biopolymer transport system component